MKIRDYPLKSLVLLYNANHSAKYEAEVLGHESVEIDEICYPAWNVLIMRISDEMRYHVPGDRLVSEEITSLRKF